MRTTESRRSAGGATRQGSARVVIADDHELARAGLRSMLAGEASLTIVGEASNGREALELCRTLKPDLALLDMRMPEMDGLSATRAIKGECPLTSVIIVTMHENPDYLFEALKAGAAGFLLKDVSQREMVTAIRHVLDGEALLNAELATQLLRRISSDGARSMPETAEHLTPREFEVLRLIAQGQTNPQIARELVLSVNTVKAHVERIIAKLGVSDRTQAAVRAVELGLIGPALAPLT